MHSEKRPCSPGTTPWVKCQFSSVCDGTKKHRLKSKDLMFTTNLGGPACSILDAVCFSRVTRSNVVQLAHLDRTTSCACAPCGRASLAPGDQWESQFSERTIYTTALYRDSLKRCDYQPFSCDALDGQVPLVIRNLCKALAIATATTNCKASSFIGRMPRNGIGSLLRGFQLFQLVSVNLTIDTLYACNAGLCLSILHTILMVVPALHASGVG